MTNSKNAMMINSFMVIVFIISPMISLMFTEFIRANLRYLREIILKIILQPCC